LPRQRQRGERGDFVINVYSIMRLFIQTQSGLPVILRNVIVKYGENGVALLEMFLERRGISPAL
jgi:hypothetical protein